MKQDEADLHKSLDYFERALVKDPGYVSAYNGIPSPGPGWLMLTFPLEKLIQRPKRRL